MSSLVNYFYVLHFYEGEREGEREKRLREAESRVVTHLGLVTLLLANDSSGR